MTWEFYKSWSPMPRAVEFGIRIMTLIYIMICLGLFSVIIPKFVQDPSHEQFRWVVIEYIFFNNFNMYHCLGVACGLTVFICNVILLVYRIDEEKIPNGELKSFIEKSC